MSATVRVHSFLNNGVPAEFQVEGRNTGECVREVIRLIPGAEGKMFAKPGRLKAHVEVLVNGHTAYPNELTAPVSDGDTVSILVMLAGG